MRLVLIEWNDSFGCSTTWQDIGDLSGIKPMVCRSVGWLAYDGDDLKVVVPHVASVPGGDKQGCGDMTIPASAVLKIRDLKVPKDCL